MKNLTILLFSTFGLAHFASAQFGSNIGQPVFDISNLIPKSPQSDALVKVNEIALSGFRGIPQISFNLYTASVGNLKIPITISYDASGIKYDDVPSSVGLKWTLQAGGEISRNINGLPDEMQYFGSGGTYSQAYFEGLNASTSAVQTYLTDFATNHSDMSQDQYSYNFLDKSGYFYYRFADSSFKDCKNPNTIKVASDSTRHYLEKMHITDDEGNIAYFGYGYDESNSVNLVTGSYIDPNVPASGTTAWKLSKLKTYTKEEATFEYDTYAYEVDKLAEESFTYRHPTDDNRPYNCNCGESSLNQQSIDNGYGVEVITHIHTPNENVQFFYSTDASLDIYKKQLDSIVVKDSVNHATIKQIHFKYGKYTTANLLRLDEVWNFTPSGDSLLIASFHYYGTGALAGISTLGRDLYNYYNGAGNTHLISTNDSHYTTYYSSADRTVNGSVILSGVLDTIYAPTGGKTAFGYDANYDGPGIHVDSITYFNNDNSIAEKYIYSCLGLEGFVYGDPTYINNIDENTENSDCPVETVYSELRQYYPLPLSPAFFDDIQITKMSSVSANRELSEEFYTSFQDGYLIFRPYLDKKIYYRNNDLSDTLRIESYIYTDNNIDSLGLDWLHPFFGYLPSQYYYLDGDWYNNAGACGRLYNADAQLYGTIEPRNNLLVNKIIKEFDQSSNSRSIVENVNSGYNDRWQRVYDTKLDSKGNLDSVYYTYLHTNSGSLSSSISSDNLYALVNKTTRYTGGTQMDQSRVSFSSHSGTILPDSFFIKRLSNSEVFDKMITGYDTVGQITEVDNKHGFYTSLFRDYNNQLLVAQASNANLSQTAYSSFEAESKGGWTYSTTISSGQCPTGTKYYYLYNHDITKSSLPSATYIVSYWGKGGYATVNSNSPTKTGKTIGDWTYYEHEVTGTSVTISGNYYVDEVRLYPKGAQMTSYTYTPLIGISSQCDATNRITYYEYDNFNRLKLIRDEDGNILKRMDYQYNTTYQQ